MLIFNLRRATILRIRIIASGNIKEVIKDYKYVTSCLHLLGVFHSNDFAKYKMPQVVHMYAFFQ